MSMRIFPTLAAAQSSTGLKDNDIVYLSGTTVVGDAGSGWYGYSSGSAATAGPDVIVVAAGGRLLRATDPSSDYATEIAAAIDAALRASVLPVSGTVTATPSGTQAISAVALPLPAGAATEDAQVTAAQIDTALRATPLPISQSAQALADVNALAPTGTPAVGSVLHLLAGGGGADSAGNPLPPAFDTLAGSFTYSSGVLTTEVKTSGANTYTRTYSYTTGDLTGISKWVKS